MVSVSALFGFLIDRGDRDNFFHFYAIFRTDMLCMTRSTHSLTVPHLLLDQKQYCMKNIYVFKIIFQLEIKFFKDTPGILTYIFALSYR